MTKSRSKCKSPTPSSTRSSRRTKPRSRSKRSSSEASTGAETKHARILAMLRSPAGTTIAALMTATDWQQHSLRGFLAGVVRRKHGLNLISEATDKGRVYRIKDAQTPSGVPEA